MGCALKNEQMKNGMRKRERDIAWYKGREDNTLLLKADN